MSGRTQVTPQEVALAASRLQGVMDSCGWKDLRTGQDTAVYNLMFGKDVVCVLPTGWGKTAALLLPGLCHGWKTLVFSPLIALMQDQVESLRARGVAADYVNSQRSPSERTASLGRWARGQTDIMFVAPERMANTEFAQSMARRAPDAVMIDEAHVISAWSNSFRHSYTKISGFVDEHDPKVVGAFSATMPPNVEGDVRRVLNLGHAEKVIYFPRRENLILAAERYNGNLQHIRKLVLEAGGTTLVYASTVKRCKEMFDGLAGYLRADKLKAGIYHGQMQPSERMLVMDAFIKGNLDVIFATKAFGMGIDKSDIRAVIHRDVPLSLEDLTQEVGRAGRDGRPSMCTTLFAQDSFDTQDFFLEQNHPPERVVRTVYNTVVRNSRKGEEFRVCDLTREEIARKGGFASSMDIAAVFEFLYSNEVLQAIQPDKRLQIRFNNAGNGLSKDHQSRYSMFRGCVETLEDAGPDGFVMVDPYDLMRASRMSQEVIKTWLKNWAAAGVLDYVPPARNKPLLITGDLDDIDFEMAEERRKLDEIKIRQVRNYLHQKDKHEYLERYFYTGTV
jgi:ATP-dependent DNA helicase RecQ